MLGLHVLDQLVLSVVANIAFRTLIRPATVNLYEDLLFIDMPAIMVVAITNRREGLLAVVALVRLLTGVDPHMHEQIAALVERLVAPHASEAGCKRVTDVHSDVRILACPLHRLFVVTSFLVVV